MHEPTLNHHSRQKMFKKNIFASQKIANSWKLQSSKPQTSLLKWLRSFVKKLRLGLVWHPEVKEAKNWQGYHELALGFYEYSKGTCFFSTHNWTCWNILSRCSQNSSKFTITANRQWDVERCFSHVITPWHLKTLEAEPWKTLKKSRCSGFGPGGSSRISCWTWRTHAMFRRDP